jgi:hypothetical protein
VTTDACGLKDFLAGIQLHVLRGSLLRFGLLLRACEGFLLQQNGDRKKDSQTDNEFHVQSFSPPEH